MSATVAWTPWSWAIGHVPAFVCACPVHIPAPAPDSGTARAPALCAFWCAHAPSAPASRMPRIEPAVLITNLRPGRPMQREQPADHGWSARYQPLRVGGEVLAEPARPARARPARRTRRSGRRRSAQARTARARRSPCPSGQVALQPGGGHGHVAEAAPGRLDDRVHARASRAAGPAPPSGSRCRAAARSVPRAVGVHPLGLQDALRRRSPAAAAG